MSQTTHPKIIRIKSIGNWLSRGNDVSGKKLSKALREDFIIRRFLQKALSQALVEDIEIERSPSAVRIIIKTARPGLIIGRAGGGVEKLKKSLQNELKKISFQRHKEIKLEVQEVKNFWLSPNLCAQWIAQQLEKRVPYRRVLKMALSKIMAEKGVKGAKVQVSGRLNGIEIARSEWLAQGQLPRQNLRADIGFGFSQAFCTYGVIGVKVWIYKGEKFD